MSKRNDSKGLVERSMRLEAKRQARIEERGGKAFLEAQDKALRELAKDRAKVKRQNENEV